MPDAREPAARQRQPELGRSASGDVADVAEENGLERAISPDPSETDVFGQDIAEADGFDHLTGTDILREDSE